MARKGKPKPPSAPVAEQGQVGVLENKIDDKVIATTTTIDAYGNLKTFNTNELLEVNDGEPGVTTRMVGYPPTFPQAFTPKTNEIVPEHGSKYPAKFIRHVGSLKGGLNAQVAIVVGGGHSAEPYYTEISGKRATFGCSGVPLVCKVRHWYSCDVVNTEPMLKWLDEDAETIKVFCEEAWGLTQVPSTGYRTNTPPPGPVTTTERDGLWHGASSAIGACELARHMGARRIFVMGVDYTDVTHPFDKVDPSQGVNRKPWDETRVMDHWRLLRNEYRQLKVELVCANPKSLLAVSKLLPVCDQLDALSQCS